MRRYAIVHNELGVYAGHINGAPTWSASYRQIAGVPTKGSPDEWATEARVLGVSGVYCVEIDVQEVDGFATEIECWRAGIPWHGWLVVTVEDVASIPTVETITDASNIIGIFTLPDLPFNIGFLPDKTHRPPAEIPGVSFRWVKRVWNMAHMNCLGYAAYDDKPVALVELGGTRGDRSYLSVLDAEGWRLYCARLFERYARLEPVVNPQSIRLSGW